MPKQFAGFRLYNWVERGTVRVFCLSTFGQVFPQQIAASQLAVERHCESSVFCLRTKRKRVGLGSNSRRTNHWTFHKTTLQTPVPSAMCNSQYVLLPKLSNRTNNCKGKELSTVPASESLIHAFKEGTKLCSSCMNESKV